MVVETRLFLLGSPAVRHEGKSVPFLNERRFQLLAHLAFSGDWVERDRLAALLWPEHEGAAARRNLRKIVFRARESAWAADLQTRGDCLRWAVTTDVAAFKQALAAGQLVEACAAYRGPLLAGLDDVGNSGFSAWLNAHRASLHAQWRDAALTALPALGTAAQRAVAARRLVDDDPLDERAVLAALAVLTRDGKRIEAQALYRAYVHQLAEELGVEPSAAVRAAVRGVVEPPPAAGAAGSVGSAPDAARSDAPGPSRDGFVGRRSERHELLALLQRPECRVITILGPGGIGKSRFAREQLPELAASTQVDVHWIALEDVHTGSQLLARIAQVLGAGVNDATDVVAQIASHHAAHGALIVLDNAEPLGALAAWLQPLLAAWPRLRLILTSRARVGLDGEWLLPLGGLAVPDHDSRDLEAASAFDAVRLFDLRARTVSPDFDLAAHLDAVIAVVERVDGMPLAIEMAAAWVRLLPPAEILRELTQSIDILQRDVRSTATSALPGHDSMQAVFRRSWDLLAPSERRALSAVTVFRGGFRREAAAAVAGASLPVLASLVDKSLLSIDAQGRFGMHPLIATWAATAVAEDDSTGPASGLRHAEFFAGWLDNLVRDGSIDARSLTGAMDVEFANCELAWSTAVRAERADLLAAMRPALVRYTESQGRWRDACAMLGAALACDAPMRAQPGLRLELLLNLSTLHYRLGDPHQCEALARSALALARTAGVPARLIGALNNIGLALLNRGEAALALPFFSEAAERARASGERRALGNALINAAIASKALGALPECLALNEEALAIQREIGYDDGVAMVLNNLGNTLRETGDIVRAREVLETGLHFSEERGLVPRLQNFRLSLGHVLSASGQGVAARQMLDRAVRDSQRGGQFQVELLCSLRLARLDLIEGNGRACLQRCRNVFARARARGFEGLALEALVVHADLHAQHGDAAYARQLREWLEHAPALDRTERDYVRARLAATQADRPPDPPPSGSFDIYAAAARLVAAHPGIAD
jgi:DNA-binding SARP family transcriptional activator/tetratricopeptide (TPR) repeat protein